MMLSAFVLSVLSFVMSAVSIHTPWFLNVNHSSKTMLVGLLLADRADQAFVPVTPFSSWCPASLTTTAGNCAEYATINFAMYLGWGVGMLLALVGALCAWRHKPSGLLVLGLALTLQCGACFGFFFRVMGLQQLVAAEITGQAVASWSLGWAGIVGLVGIFMCFCAVVSFAFTFCVAPPPAPDGQEEQPEEGEEAGDAAADPTNEPTAGAAGSAAKEAAKREPAHAAPTAAFAGGGSAQDTGRASDATPAQHVRARTPPARQVPTNRSQSGKGPLPPPPTQRTVAPRQ